ncbi:PP2C family protein-serine/threonine phosphatase [Actinomadura algeriensis]|uniref:Serine phosphatase RsbU (Regulator of sigma subunit) n=1 Tax=Actinomadura algeriensis TaxID=1679523 RepID=A0ABR9JTD3_9ACTN|nr:GAF domain-containing SpoIIE family protein phosphatase [Actinomadura algeriensis]MBE1533830.1 serine phosphatase RsbU (regulator of sigma subunit) [Actinomadura algeriensis]
MNDPAGAFANSARRLENPQTLDAGALSQLDLDDVFDVLLDHLRETLRVDTAVVLLLDRQGRFLVATAAKGIEEEVSQAAHVPVGEGFAGRVAAERHPLYIEDVPSANVFNPLLVQRGLRSLLGVPLIADGTLLGVLHVGSLTPRGFTTEETELVQLAASRAATAVRSQISRAERAGAVELQRSLVPTALPVLPGLEMAARYRPGRASVGGDWYDVFTLPSGEISFVMGDVAGHGLGAAVVMGRLRSALRAYALETSDPAEVLDKLNKKVVHFEPDATATVLYAVCDPGLNRIRLASAGHWPPVIALPDRPVRPVEMKPGLLIGLGTDVARTATTFEFPPGAVLCFYTDGLVERRGESVTDGIAALCGAAYAGPPEAVSAAVMAALIGRWTPEDDVALLVLRRSPC